MKGVLKAQLAAKIEDINGYINAQKPVYFGFSGETNIVTKDVSGMKNGVYILVNTYYAGGIIWVLRIEDGLVSAASLENEKFAPSVNGTIVTIPVSSWYSRLSSIKLA